MHTSVVGEGRWSLGAPMRRVRGLASRWVGLALAVAASALSAGALAGPAAAAPAPPDASTNYAFATLNNDNDPTFNQLLGINDSGTIAGYFGSGQTGHPNKGYLLSPNYHQGNYRNENFPHSAQTQVIGINNQGVTAGFWVDANGNNFGFYAAHHRFHKVDFPTNDNAKPQIDQLLGVNDSDVAVGFYTDAHGTNHGYSYNILRHRFRSVRVPGDSNLTAAGINDLGDVAGFATNSAGSTEAFLLRSDGMLFRLNFPGATATQAFGVNNGDEVVGDYTVGTGNSATTHGFVWAPGFGFQTVNDPNGADSTTINGVNDRGDLVGFYVDSTGNTDGLLATPQG
jgi:hypothetical protein